MTGFYEGFILSIALNDKIANSYGDLKMIPRKPDFSKVQIW